MKRVGFLTALVVAVACFVGRDLSAQSLFVGTNGAGVYRTDLNGQNATFLATGDQAWRGFAVDDTAGQLWGADVGHGTIVRMNFDGTGITNVFSGLTTPFTVKLDTVNQKVYWMELGATATIKRANYDGTGVQTVVTISHSVGFTYDFDLDAAGGKIYYIDGNYFDGTSVGVQRVNLDGSGQQTLYTGLVSSAIAIDPTSNLLISGGPYENTKVGTKDGSGALTTIQTIANNNNWIADMAYDPVSGYLFEVQPNTPGGGTLVQVRTDGGGVVNLAQFGTQVSAIGVSSATAIPEPGSVAVWAGGLVLFGVCWHCRQRRALERSLAWSFAAAIL